MDCSICGMQDLGTTYSLHCGTLCPKCEGETREYVHLIDKIPEVPKHIPREQHEKYTMSIIRRKLESHNR